MSRSIDDGHVEGRGLEAPEGTLDGDTPVSLGLQLVQDPGELEGSLSCSLGLLLIPFCLRLKFRIVALKKRCCRALLLNRSRVNPATLVDEVSA